MGTISHHQARAHEFLHRADRAIATRDPAEAAAALRRAASHITTALAVQQGWRHKSQRQLETVLHANVAADHLGRSHLKTLRQAHTMSQQADSPTQSSLPVGSDHLDASRGTCPPLADPCQTSLRRMRRRVASLITHALALIAGRPKRVVRHKLWQRRPDLPAPPDFTSVRDILTLPNYQEISDKFRLRGAGMDTDPDPHGFYERGDRPRRCPCHAELWNKPRNPHRITLSPLWRHALEKTFRIKLPDPLHLTC